jgi:hypothetical protein
VSTVDGLRRTIAWFREAAAATGAGAPAAGAPAATARTARGPA